LQDWVFPAGATATQSANALPAFARIADQTELTRQLTPAPGKPVMLDFYADWCVACKEFEKYTFRAAGVKTALAGLTLLQADVTANTPAQRALLTELRVMGLPTIVFFDAQGKEIPNSRVTGFMDAEAFQRHLQKTLP